MQLGQLTNRSNKLFGRFAERVRRRSESPSGTAIVKYPQPPHPPAPSPPEEEKGRRNKKIFYRLIRSIVTAK